jgi:hypothetical protein
MFLNRFQVGTLRFLGGWTVDVNLLPEINSFGEGIRPYCQFFPNIQMVKLFPAYRFPDNIQHRIIFIRSRISIFCKICPQPDESCDRFFFDAARFNFGRKKMFEEVANVVTVKHSWKKTCRNKTLKHLEIESPGTVTLVNFLKKFICVSIKTW